MLIRELTGPRGSYALVGLSAFLAGTTHAPLTALFLLWEMTQNDTIALPAMIATITALVVARALETDSIDEYRLVRGGEMLQIGPAAVAPLPSAVSSVLTRHGTMVWEKARLSDDIRAS